MERVSALMDGEVDKAEAGQVLSAIRERHDLLRVWNDYHLIGDAMRKEACCPSDFLTSFSARLAQEPTVLAPRRTFSQVARKLVAPTFAAAAAVAMVTWVTLETQVRATDPESGGLPGLVVVPTPPLNPIAGTNELIQPVGLSSSSQSPPPPIQLSDRVLDAYVNAHKELAPVAIMPGVTASVRLVSGMQGELRR